MSSNYVRSRKRVTKDMYRLARQMSSKFFTLVEIYNKSNKSELIQLILNKAYKN